MIRVREDTPVREPAQKTIGLVMLAMLSFSVSGKKKLQRQKNYIFLILFQAIVNTLRTSADDTLPKFVGSPRKKNNEMYCKARNFSERCISIYKG